MVFTTEWDKAMPVQPKAVQHIAQGPAHRPHHLKWGPSYKRLNTSHKTKAM